MHIQLEDELEKTEQDTNPDPNNNELKIVIVILSILIAGLVAGIIGFAVISEVHRGDEKPASNIVSDISSRIADKVNEIESNKVEETPGIVEEVQQEVVVSHPPQETSCIIARYGDVEIHSPIKNDDLTGVLFHQASYDYGLVMETILPEVPEDAVSPEVGMRVNRNQWKGDEWLDADALHLYRYQDHTLMDTSIDVGAPVGSVVYAPVTGTVVLVKDYDLYGYVPDIEIHIQPAGHPELDVVLLHQTDPLVKAGDTVVAGTTPISHVRDIAASLTDIQLGYYTLGADPGNHSHVQINDATYPGYYEQKLYLTGAFVTPERQAMHEQCRIEIERRAEEEIRAAEAAAADNQAAAGQQPEIS